MALHEAFYPLILPAVAQCPLMTVDLAINRVAHEFCRDSRAWEVDLDPIVLSDGMDRYDLFLPTGAVLVCVQRLSLDNRDLQPMQSLRSLGSVPLSGTPYHFAHTTDYGQHQVVLHPVPDDSVAGSMVVPTCTLAPTFNATTLPDALVYRYADAIAEGTKAHLKAMSGTAWFDPAGAQAAIQLFMQRKAEGRIHTETGFVAGSVRTTARAFGD